MLTAIVESNWDTVKLNLNCDDNFYFKLSKENELVRIPEKLQPYMNDRVELKIPQDFRKAEPLKSFKKY